MAFGGTNRDWYKGGQMIEELIINMVLAVLRSAVKNPKKAEELKTALLEIRDSINALYPGA